MSRQRFARWRQARTYRGLAPGPYDIRLEKDLQVPMDDGVVLRADLITPIGETDPRLPTIVIRGPYGRRGGAAGFAGALAREGFTVLFQSCRGTSGSGGVFTPQLDEERDGLATHRWVPNSGTICPPGRRPVPHPRSGTCTARAGSTRPCRTGVSPATSTTRTTPRPRSAARA